VPADGDPQPPESERARLVRGRHTSRALAWPPEGFKGASPPLPVPVRSAFKTPPEGAPRERDIRDIILTREKSRKKFQDNRPHYTRGELTRAARVRAKIRKMMISSAAEKCVYLTM